MQDIGSHKVKVWGIQQYQGTRGSSYRLRWIVDGTTFTRSLGSRKHADSFRSELLVAIRQGLAFDGRTGLPMDPSRPVVERLSWFDLTDQYVDLKWPGASARHRKGIAEALVNVTFALMDTSHRQFAEYERQELVAALTFGAFSRGTAPAYNEEALAALRAAAPDASVIGDGVAIRKVLNALALKQDGTPAAEATVIRKRATLHNLLQVAVDAGVITANPLKTIKRSGPRARTTVDPRVVINQKQGKALLAGVDADHPHLRAYFALMLFAGLRPAEARNIRRRDLELPEKGWGWVLLHSTAQVSGSAWTNDGRATEQRPLKHRSQSETRRVPLNKRAVKILRAHLDSYPCGPDGHLFVSRTGKAGKPLSPPYTSLVSVETIGRAWSRARMTALSPEQVDSVLARRPYDLRHARLTWWLNAGVPPTQVAKWAGHSVRVLLDVYAGCVDGGEKQALLLLKQD